MITEKIVLFWSATLTSSEKRRNKEYRIINNDISRSDGRYTNSLE